jgi:hypothetical protein
MLLCLGSGRKYQFDPSTPRPLDSSTLLGHPVARLSDALFTDVPASLCVSCVLTFGNRLNGLLWERSLSPKWNAASEAYIGPSAHLRGSFPRSTTSVRSIPPLGFYLLEIESGPNLQRLPEVSIT